MSVNKLKKNKKILLCNAFLSLKNVNECNAFLRDLMTEQEIENFEARLLGAVLINQGTSYRDVAKITKMSTTTVSRVAFWLKRGKGGYKTVIKRLKQDGLVSTVNQSTTQHHKSV